MQISRIIFKVLALMGLAFALTLSTAAVTPVTAGAQAEEPTDGYDGYNGDEDPPPEQEEPTTPPPDTGSTLPETGGVQLLAAAGAVAALGLMVRRLSLSS